MNIYRVENGLGLYWTGRKWSKAGRLYTRRGRALSTAEKVKGIVTDWELYSKAVQPTVEVVGE